MNKFKKIIALVLIGLLNVSLIPALGNTSDYEGHWAENAIISLISKSVISGDATGKIRPDENINRAEFIKTINRYFNYTNVASVNFPDTKVSDWYYKDLAIAKNQNYITGDQNGNANPNALVTRAEVCVILSRILGLNQSTVAEDVTDKNEIPSWAEGAIGSLLKEGLLSGYDDGTVKANSSITRAESFYLISKIKIEAKEEIKTESSSVGNTGSMVSSGTRTPSKSSSSGGGNSSDSKIANVEVTYFSKETYDIEFTATKASSILIKAVSSAHVEKEYPLSLSGKNPYKMNIGSDIISDLGTFTDKTGETFTLYVKACGISGYQDSSYEKITDLSMNFPALASPIVRASLDYNTIVFQWDPIKNAKEYQIKFLVDNLESSDYAVDWDKNEAYVNYETYEKNTITFKITAISESSNYKNSDTSIFNLVVSHLKGDGSKANPYQIITQADFEKIKKEPSACYKLMNKISLVNYTPFPFSGTLTADSLTEINVNISSTGTNIGLFSTVTGTAAIENIKLTGSVSGGSVVGGFIGLADGISSLTVTNCVNEAKVTSSTTYAGGFVGRSYGTENKLTVVNFKNYGSISANQHAGGIGGLLSGKIKNSANFGSIQASDIKAGGICSWFTGGSIDQSFNMGSVHAKGIIGGIMAITQYNNIVVTNCYNAGTLTSTNSKVEVGAIVGQVSNFSVTAANCYNIASITGSNKNQLYGIGSFSSSNSYYLDPNGDTDSDESSKSLSSIKNLVSTLGSSYIKTTNDFKFPQLKENINEMSLDIYLVTVIQPNNGTITPSGIFYQNSIDNLMVTAVANTSYTLAGIKINDTTVNTSTTSIKITEDTTITAIIE